MAKKNTQSLKQCVQNLVRRKPEHKAQLQSPDDLSSNEDISGDVALIDQSGMLDRADYWRRHPDVAAAGIDPIVHYVRHGAAEGRDPNDFFDTHYYLTQYRDVAASGMNPLCHFLRFGHRELRNPSAAFDSAAYWLTYIDDVGVDGNPLAHYLAEGRKAGVIVHKAGKVPAADKQAVVTVGRERLDDPVGYSPAVYERLASALAWLGATEPAERALRCIVAGDWYNGKVHARLARSLAGSGRWWEAVESWNAATSLDDSRADWFFELGEAQEKMNRPAAAADAYQQAIDQKPGNPQRHYRLGYMRECAGQRMLADAAYAEAMRLDKRKDVKNFGIGIFHQDRGYWPEAAEAYERARENSPLFADLNFKLGMAYDRCYRWRDAESAYRDAIALKSDSDPYQHYRLGFVLERQHELVQ